MATPNVGILTTAGKSLIDKVNSGQTKISFSKIVFSSMDNSQLSDMQVKALTAIAPQEVVVSSPETTLDTNSGETRIRATGTNEKLADGVYVKTYGVFAKDDTGSEILYGVTVSPNPNYFPAYDGVTPQAVTYSYKTVIQETSNITMTNSNDVYASQEDLAEAIQPCAKTVDVNQQLNTKVNTADMRKPASDVAGIEEVNAKQDKIAYTPADDSKVVHSTDTSNWQKYPITDVNGSLTAYIGPDYPYTSIKQLIDASINGIYTVYIDERVTDTPDSSDNLRGIIQLQSDHVWGILTGELTKVSYYVGGTYKGNASDLNWIKLANDSQVAHLSGDETIGGNKTFTNPIKGTVNGITYRYSSVGDDLDTSYMNDSVIYAGTNKVTHAPAGTDGTWAIIRNYNSDTTNGAQSYYDTNQGVLYVRTRNSNSTYTPWIKVADDSKVAHLSGANNFDTVPTVNNNPLLLASSLPSDLARTSQQTNFTAGLQSGGVDVATAADLKSVEDSAWRQLDNSKISVSTGVIEPGTYVLYRLDTVNKRLYFMFTIGADVSSTEFSLDFRSIVNNISTPNLTSFSNKYMQNSNIYSFAVLNNLIEVDLYYNYGCSLSASYTENGNTKYDLCFVNYDELV